MVAFHKPVAIEARTMESDSFILSFLDSMKHPSGSLYKAIQCITVIVKVVLHQRMRGLDVKIETTNRYGAISDEMGGALFTRSR